MAGWFGWRSALWRLSSRRRGFRKESKVIGQSESKTTETQTGASDQARIVSGKGAVLTESGSLALTGKGSTYLSPGSLQVGAKGQLNTGLQLSNVGGDVTFTSSDPGVLAMALDRISELSSTNAAAIENLASKSAQAASEAIEASKANLDDLLANIASLSENRQTDGEAGKNKIVLYVVLAVLALLGLLLWRK